MTQGLVGFLAFVHVSLSQYPTFVSPVGDNFMAEYKQEEILASKTLDLQNRSKSQFVNDVFKYNILLAVDKMESGFVLQPGEIFAFHDNFLTEFKDKVVKTTNSHFMADEGYKHSGYIVGDGVCHLASLMNLVASEAGLEVIAKVNHDFNPVPDINREYGTSIVYAKVGRNSQNQNLYIKNNFDYPVEFRFTKEDTMLKLALIKK